MRCAVLGVLLAGLAGLTVFGASPQVAKSPSQNQWRYAFFNGDWWYWLPENRWVYWRNGRWNDFPPPTANAGGGFAPARRAGPPATQSEIRPFYGHAQSSIDYGPSREEEVGPFYGHALPRDVFGTRPVPRMRIRPYYGHAASSTMY